jgi:hypothetical protein
MQETTLKKLGAVVVGAAFVLSALATDAEARRGRRNRGPTWVPNKAWRAVKTYARAHYDPQAKLFKTDATKAQSLGLKGAVSDAWIVGASCARQPNRPIHGFMPYKPQQTYYLVTKGQDRRWQVTQLAGMGSYLSKVDAASDNPSVGVRVGLGIPSKVGHGVEVKNTRYLTVSKGTALAKKANGPTTHTVYVKGATPSSPYALGVEATLRAAVPPPPGDRCGTAIPRSIPVHFTQVMFARGARGPAANAN